MSEALDDFVGVQKLESKEGLRLVGARWAKGSILQGGSYETWLLFKAAWLGELGELFDGKDGFRDVYCIGGMV